MPLRCRSSGVECNVVVAASLLDGGSTSLGAAALLAAVFQSRLTDDDTADNEDLISSALCVYRMSEVRDAFTRNIRRCFAAQQKYVGLQFSNRICVSLVSISYSNDSVHLLSAVFESIIAFAIFYCAIVRTTFLAC